MCQSIKHKTTILHERELLAVHIECSINFYAYGRYSTSIIITRKGKILNSDNGGYKIHNSKDEAWAYFIKMINDWSI